MNTQHTPGQLIVSDPHNDLWAILGEPPVGWPTQQYAIAVGIRNGEDARRLVACWNACEGLSTEAIEAVSVNTGPLLANKLAEVDALGAYTGQLQRQRDQLLAALERLLNAESDKYLTVEGVRILARAAIAACQPTPAVQHLPADEAGFKMAQHTLQTLQPMSQMRAKAILSARAANVHHLPADDTEGGAA